MDNFILTPQMRKKRQKLKLELGMLKIKEKIFGKLSEKDKERKKEIMKEFMIHY